jgi:hypothetical protein
MRSQKNLFALGLLAVLLVAPSASARRQVATA